MVSNVKLVTKETEIFGFEKSSKNNAILVLYMKTKREYRTEKRDINKFRAPGTKFQ